MANPIKGERDIKLNGIKYTLRLTMDVIVEFQEMREKDFMSCATRAVNAWIESKGLDRPLARAECMTCAVDLDDAATLFWLAAKSSNSQVEFGEIQEALIDDIDIANDDLFYPALFADLCSFTVMGKKYKKKVMDSSSGSQTKE